MIPVYAFEDSHVERLYPLTYSRAPFELRAGVDTLLERMQRHLRGAVKGVLVRSALASVVRTRIGVPANPVISCKEGIILLNARWLMLADGATEVEREVMLAPNRAGLKQDTIAWIHLSPELAAEVDWSRLHEPPTLEALLPRVQRRTSSATLIERPWHLLDWQRAAILEDFSTLGPANQATLFPGVHLLSPENIHLAKAVKIWPGAVLDAQNGPIIVGEATEIRANAILTGPVAIGRHCIIRTGADIREDCVFGPGCRVGGEVIASLLLGHVNKQHHGFLGQSILGEWVNLGAGTTTSNLKNTYGQVKMPVNGIDEPTGRQFLGAVIADHAKLGIGTYLSTGSVVGFGSHIVVDRPPRFTPSFAWVTDKGIQRAEFEKIEQIAATVMHRRGVEFTPADHELFVRIAGDSSQVERYAWPNA